MKILRLEGGLMLVYKCVQETYEEACKPEGIHVYLLGRATTASLEDMIPLLDALPAVCLKPENMKSVKSTGEWGCSCLCGVRRYVLHVQVWFCVCRVCVRVHRGSVKM